MTTEEQLLHSTVRIETVSKNGERASGTGYFFRFCEKDNGDYIPVIITNKHVIRNAELGYFFLTKANDKNLPIYGSHELITLENFENEWIMHPDPNVDLCAISIGKIVNLQLQKQSPFYYLPFRMENLPSLKELDWITNFKDIFMIGYPDGLWDPKNNLPIARRGFLASHPKFDFNGRKEFMVDIACFPGSSGSPVIVVDTRFKYGFKLIGTLYAGPQHTARGDVIITEIGQKYISETAIPNHLGFAIKFQRIQELEKEVFKFKVT